MTRANLIWLLLFVLVGMGGAAIYTARQPVLYRATSSGYVVVAGLDSYSSLSVAQKKAEAYVPFIGSQGIWEKLRAEMGKDVPSGWMNGSVKENTQMIVVQATSNTGEGAAKLANGSVRALAKMIEDLERLGRNNQGVTPVQLFPLEDAQIPRAPYSPNWLNNLAMGAGIGLVIGYAFAFARRALDGRLRYSKDVEEITGRSTLGVVPKTNELRNQRTSGSSDTGVASEALRQFRTNLRFVDVDDPPKSIVVTSCNPGEGKSTVSANLARLLAEAGNPTILIDADLRRPMMHRIFQTDNAIGLTQLLAGDTYLDDVLQDTDTNNLQIIPAGRIPPNPSELVGSQRMHRLIELLSKDHMVIVDAPPMLPVTDAGLLTRSSDGALLVLAVGKTYKEQLRLATKLFAQIDGRLLGSVMNMAPLRQVGSVVYGYGYGYGSYQRTYGRYESKGKVEPKALPVDESPAAPLESQPKRMTPR